MARPTKIEYMKDNLLILDDFFCEPPIKYPNLSKVRKEINLFYHPFYYENY